MSNKSTTLKANRHPKGSLDKKALLQSYLQQQRKDPKSYSISSRGEDEAIASSAAAALASSPASSVITNTSTSTWQSQRYQQAKLRSRQTIQAKKKHTSSAAPAISSSSNGVNNESTSTSSSSSNSGGSNCGSSNHGPNYSNNSKARTTHRHSNNSDVNLVLKDIQNSPKHERKNRKQLIQKNLRGSPQQQQPQSQPLQRKSTKEEMSLEKRSRDTNDNKGENLNNRGKSDKVKINETNEGNPNEIKPNRNRVKKEKDIDEESNNKQQHITESSSQKSNAKAKSAIKTKSSDSNNSDSSNISKENYNHLNQMTTDESFEEFMVELNREIKFDHVELLHKFQTMMNSNSKQLTETSSPSISSDKKKRKRIKLSTKTTTHLASINQLIRKKVRKSHFANKSQVPTDKQIMREKRSRGKESGSSSSGGSSKKGGNSSSSSTSSSSTSVEKIKSTDKKEKNWKKKLINTKNAILHEKEENEDRSLPKVIKLQSSDGVTNDDDDDDDDDNDSLESVPTNASSHANTSKGNDIAGSQPPREKAKLSHSISLSKQFKKSLRPPLPPSMNHDSNSDQSKKSSIPRWRAVLLEKQKAKRKEERLKAERSEDDDDNKSINTVDIDRSAEDAVGKSKVISIFGKLVPLKTKPKLKHLHLPPPSTIESDDGNSSPWAIKLKPVNRKSMGGCYFNSHESVASTPIHDASSNESFTPASSTRAEAGYTPSSSIITKEPDVVGKRSPLVDSIEGRSIEFSLNPGDVIDLNNLPQPEFDPNVKPIIVPITNNNGNRNQVVILGEEILLIASRFADEEIDSDSDKANILWYTARSQIVTLALNNRADGVSISIENGTSFPLNFMNCNQCFSFVQTYYNMKQSDSHSVAVEEDAFKTPSSRSNIEKTPSTTYTQDSVAMSAPYTTPIVDAEKASYNEESEYLEPKDGLSVQSSEPIADNIDMSKYRTMLKCGIPEEAVRHQMNRDGVDAKLQETVFIIETHETQQNENETEEYKSPQPSKGGIANMLEAHFQKKLGGDTDKSAAANKIQTPVTKSGIESMLEDRLKNQLTYVQNRTPIRDLPALTKEEEEIASKYKKMLKVGMPKEAVLHAMKRFQVSEKVTKAVEKVIDEETSGVDNNSRSQEEERILNRFRKMLRMNVPREHVRNKMTLENVDKNLIEEVLGKSEDGVSPDNDKEEQKEKSAPKVDEGVPMKFKRMLKMGIPSEAVRHAMIKDSIEEKIIDSFFGSEKGTSNPTKQQVTLNDDEKKEVETYKKMLKIGLPEGAVRNKMAKQSASESVISAVFDEEKTDVNCNPGSAQKRKKSDLIHVHWEKLSSDKVENANSCWFRSAKKPKFDTHDIDMDILKELFKKPTKDQKSARKSSAQEKEGNKLAGILQMNRAQNVSISLQAFKGFSIDQLVEIIKNLDANNEIKGDRVEFMEGLLPKKEETDAIQKYVGEEKYLNNAEVFFKKLLSVPRVSTKIKVMKTMELFHQNFDDIFSKFNILQKTCNDVVKSEKLQLILESVLAIGNIMNQGTYSGNAQGIKFDSLLKLTQTKSKDQKMSVLDYIVRMFIDKNERDVLDLNSDFPECNVASRILITDVKTSFSSLGAAVKICKTEMNKIKNEQKEKGMQFTSGFLRLEAFITKSEASMAQLKEAQEKASDGCKELAEYCGEEKEERAARPLLMTLTEFTTSINHAVLKYNRQQEQEAKKEARKKKLNETSNNTNASIDTPKRALFKTPSTNKTSRDSIVSQKAKIESVKKPTSLNHANTPTIRASQIIQKESNDEAVVSDSSLQAIIKKRANDTVQEEIHPTRALLHSIQKRKSQDEAHTSNQDQSFIKNSETRTMRDLQKPQEEEVNDPREAILQSIKRRARKDSSLIERPDPTASIVQQKSKDEKIKIDKLEAKKKSLDPRKDILESIVKRQETTLPTNASNQQQHIVDRTIEEKQESKQEIYDPREAMLQSIVQRKAGKDSSGLERPFPTSSSNQLLHKILERKALDEKDMNSTISKSRPPLCFPDEEHEGANDGERKVFRSSRSLGCGILPDLDIAIPTFDPS